MPPHLLDIEAELASPLVDVRRRCANQPLLQWKGMQRQHGKQARRAKQRGWGEAHGSGCIVISAAIFRCRWGYNIPPPHAAIEEVERLAPPVT